MLSQFSVKNYKSIRDEATLDMQAVAISEHEDKIIRDVDGENYLPVAAIYGPNGGGKSNVLEALNTLVAKIMRPLYAAEDNGEGALLNKRIIVEPFRFSESKDFPTEFELFFRTDTAEYKYALHIKRDIVVYESLDRVKFDTGRPSALFEREGVNIELKGDFSKLKVAPDFSPTLTLLSYLGITYEANPIVSDVIGWFQHRIGFLNYSNSLMERRLAVSISKKFKNLFLEMIREMDLDILDYRVNELGNDAIEIYTKHKVGNYEAELNISEESSGTQKLFSLLPYIAESLVRGRTLVIDELDAKLHPLLLKHIITWFTDFEVNKNKAQLVITSHDLSTMNKDVFRRDEIWFVAKGNEQNSKLYSLVEFKNEDGKSVRKDAKYDKQYLEGKYGADPYLRRIIDWGEVNA